MIPTMIAKIPTAAISSTGLIPPVLQKAARGRAGSTSSFRYPTLIFINFINPLTSRSFEAAWNLIDILSHLGDSQITHLGDICGDMGASLDHVIPE